MAKVLRGETNSVYYTSRIIHHIICILAHIAITFLLLSIGICIFVIMSVLRCNRLGHT